MAFVTPTQTSFNGGLWARRLFGRTDLDGYRTACGKLVNFIPAVSGSLRKRPGTQYAGEAKVATGSVRLIPFIFSATDAMVIELTDSVIRFWKNGSIVLSGGVPFEVASPYTSAQLIELDWCQSLDTVIITHQSHPPKKLQRFADNNWTLTDLSFIYAPTLPSGFVASNERGDAGLTVATNAWLTSAQDPQAAPINGGSSASAIVNFNFRENPVTGIKFIAKDGQEGGDTNVSIFDFDRDVGRQIVINCYNLNGHRTIGGGSADGLDDLSDSEVAYPLYCTITDVMNGSGVSVGATNTGPEIEVTIFDGYAGHQNTDGGIPALWISTQKWFMDAIYSDDSGTNEYPKTCTFFEERLWLGATPGGPDTVYASRTGTLDDFDIFSAADATPQKPTENAGSASRLQPPNPQAEILATSGLSVGIAGNEISQIEWIRPLQQSLLIATSRGIFQITSATNDGGFGPTGGIKSLATNAIGSTLRGLGFIQDKLLFLIPSADRMYQMGFELTQDSFQATEVSLFNPDILADGIEYMSLSQDHEPIGWMNTASGGLVGLTIDNQQRVFGWHEHQLGGTDVVVEGVAVIPDASGDDNIYLAVKRTVDGNTVRYIEFMGDDWRINDNPEDQIFMDSAVVDTSGLSTITGLSHLEGETVQVLRDGAYAGTFTVSGGAISIGTAGTTVRVGLGFVAEYNSMPLVVRDPQGSNFSKRATVNRVALYLVRSTGGECAAGPEDGLIWRPIAQRTAGDGIGLPLSPVTGAYVVEVRNQPSRSPVMAVRNSVPFNFEFNQVQAWVDSSSR